MKNKNKVDYYKYTMSIQNIFFLLGSIYLGLGIIVSLGMIMLIIYIARVVASMKTHIEENLHRIKDTVAHVGEAAQEVGVHPFSISERIGKFLLQLLGYGIGRLLR